MSAPQTSKRSQGVQSAPVRIILDADHAAQLAEAGECFAIVARGSYPDSPGRFVLHAIPASIERIDAAVRVARGELLTRKPPKQTGGA